MKSIYFTVYILFFTVSYALGAKSEKMKLQDLQVLTLKSNRMTTGRRSSPVPQLKCMENCPYNLPQVVQCTNRGWDGSSVQWECKAEMDQGYRFGDLEVICEGYDYPDDPYILTGSCGLEYTLRSDNSQHQGHQQQSYGWQDNLLNKKNKKSGSQMQDIILLVVVGGIIYVLYKTCLSGRNVDPTTADSTTNGDYPPDDRQTPNMGWNIPGMGGYNQGAGSGYASCGAGGTGGRNRGGAGGGGFWTGLATGGLLGYMFGGNRNAGYQQQGQYYGRQAPSSGFFGQSQPSYSSAPSYSSSSTSSSTGFAGTRRR